MKQRRIYWFASGNFVFNDKIIPIILELARQGARVETILFTESSVRQLLGDTPYGKWVRSFTCVRRILTVRNPTLFCRLRLYAHVVFLWICFRLRRGYIVFFDAKGSTPVTRLLGEIARTRGRVIVYPAWYADAWHGFDWTGMWTDPEKRALLMKGPPKPPAAPNVHDTLLVYNRSMVEHGACTQRDRHAVVPQPKLQPWWDSFVRAHPPEYDNPALASLDEWIVLLTRGMGNYLFPSDSDVDVLIDEVMRTVRTVFPDMPVVIKPKLSVDHVWLREYIASHGYANVYISESPIGVLAHRARAGVTIGHTTGQFEFVSPHAPWIEHCRYSVTWRQLYPSLSYTERYGGYWSQTPEELSMLFTRLRDEQLPARLDIVRDAIGFFEQPISFDYFFNAAIPEEKTRVS
jgi:hypothetical protein